MTNFVKATVTLRASVLMVFCLTTIFTLNAQAEIGSANIKNIGDEIAALAGVSRDAIAFENRAASLEQRIASAKAAFHKQALGVAYQEYRIPELERSLQQSIRMDDNAPGYRARYGKVDSDETSAVRDSLLRARSAAYAAVPSILNVNGDYLTLLAYDKTLADLRRIFNSRR